MADKRLPVVVVHGIGSGRNKDRAGFSRELSRDVHEALRPVIRVGPEEEVQAAPGQAPQAGIYWEEALWENENEHDDEKTRAVLNTFGLRLVAHLLDILGDVPFYLDAHGEKIRGAVKAVIRKHANCIVVAHSLGSVIAADILREAQLADNFNSLPVSGLVTLGSPLNMLGLRNPMNPGDSLPFTWHNFYYPKDPITLGKPLRATAFPGVKNHKLSAGETFAVSHTSYWSSVVVASAVYKLSRGSP